MYQQTIHRQLQEFEARISTSFAYKIAHPGGDIFVDFWVFKTKIYGPSGFNPSSGGVTKSWAVLVKPYTAKEYAPVGDVFLVGVDEADVKETDYRLHRIEVYPPYQGKGYGVALVALSAFALGGVSCSHCLTPGGAAKWAKIARMFPDQIVTGHTGIRPMGVDIWRKLGSYGLLLDENVTLLTLGHLKEGEMPWKILKKFDEGVVPLFFTRDF